MCVCTEPDYEWLWGCLITLIHVQFSCLVRLYASHYFIGTDIQLFVASCTPEVVQDILHGVLVIYTIFGMWPQTDYKILDMGYQITYLGCLACMGNHMVSSFTYLPLMLYVAHIGNMGMGGTNQQATPQLHCTSHPSSDCIDPISSFHIYKVLPRRV